MERRAAIAMLYDTLDELVAMKIDLHTATHDDPAAAKRKLTGVVAALDEVMLNIRTAVRSLEEHLQRTEAGG
jgi:hypothetical protein